MQIKCNAEIAEKEMKDRCLLIKSAIFMTGWWSNAHFFCHFTSVSHNFRSSSVYLLSIGHVRGSGFLSIAKH